MKKNYCGFRSDSVGEATVSVNGSPLDPRCDLYNHSPCGFQWGYAGSGPAQLALALCADVLGDDARALRVYQDFKMLVIAPLRADTWNLSSDDIRSAIEQCEEGRRNAEL